MPDFLPATNSQLTYDDAKGKRCPKCSEPLSSLSSQFVRLCTNGYCGAIWPWVLKKDQAPLISHHRDRRVLKALPVDGQAVVCRDD